MRTLPELIGPPPTTRSWEDEWVQLRVVAGRIAAPEPEPEPEPELELQPEPEPEPELEPGLGPEPEPEPEPEPAGHVHGAIPAAAVRKIKGQGGSLSHSCEGQGHTRPYSPTTSIKCCP